ncbi:MAG: cellulase, partial [Ignavibacteria bacterium]|nr:cellulase [Ignavibacteria bacterium]
MKRFLLLAYLFLVNYQILGNIKSWIRINQLGYQVKSIKVAVLISKEEFKPKSFSIFSALTDEVVYQSNKIKAFGKFGSFASSFRLNFSDFTKEGAYYLKVGEIKSPTFKISDEVYDGTADFLLRYMRQQRCGYNPLLDDSCHTQDGFIIYHPNLDSTFIDVVGGWHD